MTGLALLRGRTVNVVSRSLRLKISLGVSLVLLLLLAPFNIVQYRMQRNSGIADLGRLAATTGAVAEHSLEGAMLGNNRAAIQTIVDSVADAPDVEVVYLLNTQAIVASSPGGRFNGQQLDRNAAPCNACHQYPAATRPHSVVLTPAGGPPVFRTMTPILNRPACVTCHSPSNRLNGALYVDFSMAGLNERLERELRTALLASAGVVGVSALAIYGLLSWLAITPMEQLGRALRRFSRGERGARAVVRSADEVGLLARGFNEMADTIQTQETRAEQLYVELEAKDEARRQLLRRLTAAREEERRYLARELHDQLGQLLTGLSLHLTLSKQAVPSDGGAAGEHLDRANALISDIIGESHRLILDLHPTVLDDYGLIPALREELEHRLAPLGIRSELSAGGDIAGLPSEIATTAFRIAQEAVTNIIRHAQARRVEVRVERGVEWVVMLIDDDGVGLPQPASDSGDAHRQSLGILGMQERADALGGVLEVTNREPCGVRVRLAIPLSGSAP